MLSFPSILKPSGLTVLDMMVPNDMVQISTPAPRTGYTVKSLFCISSEEKLPEFYEMVTDYSGLYQKPLVVQKITILNYEKTTHTLFKPIYEPILSTNSENHIKNIKKLYTWDTSTEIIAAATILQLIVHTHSRTHARTHARTHTHTHTQHTYTHACTPTHICSY